MNSTARELVDRIEGFTIGNFVITDLKKYEDGPWFVRAEITADLKGLEAYEFCRCLNGWDKTDYFSVLTINVVKEHPCEMKHPCEMEHPCIEATVLRVTEKREVEE